MTYKITADACSDLTVDFAKKNDIAIIPFEYFLDGKPYIGTLEKTAVANEFYDLLENTEKTTTSLINEATHGEFFESFLKKGEDLIHVTVSSGLSGTFNAAKKAADALQEKYPERKIFVLDSLNVSAGEGALVHYLSTLRDEGKSIEEAFESAKTERGSISTIFTVDNLTRLHKGGRLSAAQSLLGGLLDIKPILKINEEGKLIAFHKVRKRKRAIDYLFELIKKDFNPDKPFFVQHGDALADANDFSIRIESHFDIQSGITNFVGPVVGCHGGKGVLGIIYTRKN